MNILNVIFIQKLFASDDAEYSFTGQSTTVGVSLYVLCLTSMSEVEMVKVNKDIIVCLFLLSFSCQ